MGPNIPMEAELRAVFDKYGQMKQQEREMHAGGGGGAKPPSGPLNNGGEGGKSPNMEPRIAKLEASMDHVKAELAKLASVPIDVATIKERLNHIPTTSEMTAAIESAVDRIGTRTQRIVGIATAGVGATVGLITLAAKLLNG